MFHDKTLEVKIAKLSKKKLINSEYGVSCSSPENMLQCINCELIFQKMYEMEYGEISAPLKFAC